MLSGSIVDLGISIFGFALSVGGFVQFLLIRERVDRKIIVLTMTLVALVTLSGYLLIESYNRIRTLTKIMDSIVQILSDGNAITSDEIYSTIYPYQDYSIFIEALNQLIQNNTLKHKFSQLATSDGNLVRVRLFYKADSGDSLLN